MPIDVLERAQDELLNWGDSGVSVMEMSHRGKEFQSIIARTEGNLRTLLNVPDNYQILFAQGGASTQFSSVPLNLTTCQEDVVDHIVTGSWSKKAVAEAKRYARVNVAATGDNASIPPAGTWALSDEAKYVHYCDNETIQGVEFQVPPAVGDKILVADMSSNFCSRPVDVSKFGIIVVWGFILPAVYVISSAITNLVFKDALVLKAECPSCGTKNFTYFGDILTVAGNKDANVVECPECKSKLRFDADSRMVEVENPEEAVAA